MGSSGSSLDELPSTFDSARTPPSAVPTGGGLPASAARASGEVSTRTIVGLSVVLGIFLVASVTFGEAQVRDLDPRSLDPKAPILDYVRVAPNDTEKYIRVAPDTLPARPSDGTLEAARSPVIGCFFQYCRPRRHLPLVVQYPATGSGQRQPGNIRKAREPLFHAVPAPGLFRRHARGAISNPEHCGQLVGVLLMMGPGGRRKLNRNRILKIKSLTHNTAHVCEFEAVLCIPLSIDLLRQCFRH